MSDELNLYSLALECNDLAQQYDPNYHCTVHQMVGHFPPVGAWDDGWLEGLTVRVWHRRPPEDDALVFDLGPADYPEDLVEWLRRGLAAGPEDKDGFLGASPKQSAHLLRLAFHPLTEQNARIELLRELLPCLPRSRAAQLTADFTANIADLAPTAIPGRGWIATAPVELHPAPHPFAA